MRRHSKRESPVVYNRFFFASIVVLLVLAVLSLRLWYIQVYKGDHYLRISLNNRVRKIEIPAPRGVIYDRHGKALVGNRPFFDLVYIPQYAMNRDTTLNILSNLLHIPMAQFERMLNAHRGRPKFLPITLKRNLSVHEVSLIQTNKVYLPGIEINVAPRRHYSSNTPPHIVGYLGEATPKNIKTVDPENPYLPGDLIGKQGLELRWEKFLRGKRGQRLIQVDAFGRQINLFENAGWDLPSTPAQAGANLVLTLDLELQTAAKKAFQGKNGAVIALNPKNGEILAMVSYPDFDLSMYQDGISPEKWQELISDPFKPLFDKTTGGTFAPGSVYKSVVALAGLEENVITSKTSFFCNGGFELGKDVFHCHQRKGHGSVDYLMALVLSCDVFFFNVGIELGVDRIAKYAMDLGLGSKLGVNLNQEETGLIPTTKWKKEVYDQTMTLGDTPSIAIGQGANLLTPMQIASLYSTIANGGKLWRPFLVRKIVSPVGSVIMDFQPELIRETTLIKPQTFALLRKALGEVVAHPRGTGRFAQVPGHTVAGKTGSAQVVSLKKNRDRKQAVSMKWQEHAIFASFSPVEDAEIVVIVVSENDTVGGGMASAAPIAKKILEAYWNLKDERLNLASRDKPD